MKLNLVPRERRFYELFGLQGELVSDTLTELSKSLLEGRSRHARLHDLEHMCEEVTAEIYDLAAQSSAAPMQREDILALASALDEVVDLAEEAADKLELYQLGEVTEPAKAVGELLASAGEQLAAALGHLDTFEDLDARRAEIRRLEDECDRTTREALGRLLADEGMPARDLLKWKDLYDLLEQAMDGCKDVANLLASIAIKTA
jgi:uncharacterized protein